MAENPVRKKLKSTIWCRSENRMPEETRRVLPKALLKIFKTHKVCSFHEICRKLNILPYTNAKDATTPVLSHSEATAAKQAVHSSQEEVEAIINEVAVEIHGFYVLKSSPDFPQYNALRKVVIAFLIDEGPDAKLKRASVLEAARLQLNEYITDTVFLQVVSEICRPFFSGWVLNSPSN